MADGTAKSPSIEEPKYKTQTHRTVTTVEQTWILENFSYYVDGNEMLYSEPFTLRYGYPSFSLALRPFGPDEVNKEHVSLYLVCNGKPPKNIHVEYEFSIIDGNCEHMNSEEFDHIFGKKSYHGNGKFIARSKLLDPEAGLLNNNQLEIYCKITATFNRSTSGLPSSTESADLVKRLQGFNKLFDNGHYSDVILVVDGIEIPTHKAILSAGSSVFECLFEYPRTKEAQEGKVIIEDVDVDTFKVLLKYLYSGQIPEPVQLTEELLIVSDKYLISDLKKFCEEHLSSMLTIDSAAQLYLFADTHYAYTLKTNCLHFIHANTAKVMASEGWMKMLQIRPELVNSILGHFVRRFAESESRRG